MDWKGLLEEFASDLKLDLDVEQDLTVVAQYHLNREPARSRLRLHAKLVEEFSKSGTSAAHDALAKLPIDLVWTSNYDTLVEDSFRAAGRTVRVKNSSAKLIEAGSKAATTVFKLHGDLEDPKTIVITRDDYRTYTRNFPGFRDRLRADLSERTFLFLGFSFTDPHLDLILNELRLAFGDSKREHFVVMRREPLGRRGTKRYGYARNRQMLKVEDLATFGIRTLLVDAFDEVPSLLLDLDRQLRRTRVFISGAADDFEPRGQRWLEGAARELGRQLIADGYDIISGFGKGIGPHLLSGALEQLYSEGATNIDRRLILKPFPYSSPRRDLYTKYRTDLLASAGFAIFIAGNKVASDGSTTVPSDGVHEEFRLALEGGAIPLPIGSTGWVAEELWPQVKGDWQSLMSATASKRDFNILNRRSTTVPEILEALARLMTANRTA
ncbi:SIR2 family protein [Microbacterium sp. NPDC055910]|uniref:SIR2 family protein n=1 Tax=Microbacterium sp. NPDC055910 TaxID=3345659 RepID=UPI0035E0893A